MIAGGLIVAVQLASAPVCTAPLALVLNARDGVEIGVSFKCRDERGTIEVRRGCGVPVRRSHDFTRADVRVDRDGSKALRLIDRRERANDLFYRDGAVELWRSGRRLWRMALPVAAECG